MSRTGVIVLLLSLVLLTVTGIWLAGKFERRTITVPTGLTGEAATNPLLAAERFLVAMGIPARRVTDPARVPQDLAPGDLLIITHERRSLGRGRSRELLDWVRRGGRLLVTVEPPEFDEATDSLRPLPDPLLEELRLSVRPVPTDTKEETSPEPLDIEWPGAQGVLRVRLARDRVIDGARAGDLVLENDRGALMVRRHLGTGQVTVLNDLDFLRYTALGEADHARFFWYLTDGRGTVWLLQDIAMPSLATWLWQRIPQTILTLVLLLGLWLWSRAPRFGPLLPVPPPRRRRLLEHVDASGHFLWRQDRQATLLAALREAILERAARRHPAWSAMDDQARAAWLSEHHHLEPELARALLAGGDALAPAQRPAFTRLVRQLQTLRKNL